MTVIVMEMFVMSDLDLIKKLSDEIVCIKFHLSIWSLFCLDYKYQNLAGKFFNFFV